MSDSVIPLHERILPGSSKDPDEILGAFLGWVGDRGLELYAAQEEAILELLEKRHVILNTPTGSGKSLVAQALQFKGLCEGRRSFYTSPIKALASEKFFALCGDFGPENVGMLTGDASINPKASVICCTAEVLSNMSLRQGEELNAPYVIMDEFHYYADPDRGTSWQIPLITLPTSQFLLMSATLGDTSSIEERLHQESNREVARVASEVRPVPLDFEYRETPLHETIWDLRVDGRVPVYVVSFTQRECAELAQSLTSLLKIEKEEKRAILDGIAGTRFDTPYGKELRRIISFGIGIHHAGLLPRYRLLVEQLAQKGLLKVICGTDTLGVGVNIPIRTVLFNKLCKFDGRRVKILSVRDFKQIAGRAGRKGFDDRGSVVCQAPEYVIENRQMEIKAAGNPHKRKKMVKKRPPARGFVPWDRETFQRLIDRPPERLRSRFRITHGLVLSLLQRDAELNDPNARNFDSLKDLIARSHEPAPEKAKHLTQAALLVRSLHRAGLIKTVKDRESEYRWVVVNDDLQWDFSLLQALALFMVETLENLEPSDEEFPLSLVSVVESILETPQVIIRMQVDKQKGDLIARLKAEGVPYEERMDRLDEVTHPKPMEDFLETSFARFRQEHPWIMGEWVEPKSIGREMLERFDTFGEYVKRYKLHRTEGVLLRYLSQLYKTLAQSVPERTKTEEIYEVIGFFRALLERIDTSLLEEWESLVHPELRFESEDERRRAQEALRSYELLHDPKAFAARVRAEMHQLLRELAFQNWDDAPHCVRQDPDDPWDAERFQEVLAPFITGYGPVVFSPEARRRKLTTIQSTGQRTWKIFQTLLDPDGDNMWAIEAEVDLRSGQSFEGPLLRLIRIGV